MPLTRRLTDGSNRGSGMPQSEVRVFCTESKETPFVDWLERLGQRQPKAFAKILQRILQLEEFGYELRRPLADQLRGGIHELRTRSGKVNYRVLYFFCGANIVCLSHGISKEGKVPDAEIVLAMSRKELVESDPEKYTAEWEE